MDKQQFFAGARRDLTGPLQGIRVLEASTSWAAPVAGCILADYGAEVVKVEQPDGEILRHLPPYVPQGDRLPLMYEIVNRNKQSLSLDLSVPEGRDILLRLLPQYDVFLENFKPGTLAAWGLAYEDLKQVRPDIIYVSISGFGQYGPLHDRVAYDPLAQAFTGWMSLNGEVGGQPIKAPTFLADDLSGLHSVIATLAALRHRDQTGEGQQIDICLVDSVIAFSNGHPSSALLGLPVEKHANEFPTVAPFNTYECEDGWIYAGAVLDAQWAKLCKAMGLTELAADERFRTVAGRVANRDAVNRQVAGWCRKRPRSLVIQVIASAGVPVAAVNDFETAARSDHVREREMLPEVTLRDGSRVPLTGPVAKFSRTPVGIRQPAQALGAQNEQILASIGLDPDALARLSAAGVV